MKLADPMKASQRGMALLFFAILILTISSTVFLYSTNNTFNADIKSSEKTYRALSEAKASLEQLALNFIPDTSLGRNEIGRLPFPDNRFDGAYDGLADCLNYSSALNNMDLFLGRFPWLGTQNCFPEIRINKDLRDAYGNRLWYAVSPNMVDNINNIGFSPTFLNDSPARENWLSVYHANGTLISNRVAFIVFSVGAPLAGQQRLNAHPQNFLDTFNAPEIGSINNYDNDLIFIKAPISNTFNDQLIFMTIDELLPKLERRVLSEIKTQLNVYQLAQGFYPLPARLGTTDCDISLQNAGGGLIATTDLAAAPCNQPLLSLPSYLSTWLPYVIYEPRQDCNQNNQSGCNNQTLGLTLNEQTNIDFILFSTGFNAMLEPSNRVTYLEDEINQLDNQTFISPTNNQSIFQDQLIYQ